MRRVSVCALGLTSRFASGLIAAAARQSPRLGGTRLQYSSMDVFASRSDPSWTTQLSPDPESGKHAPNRASREVKSGHYVPVDPTPIKAPELLLYSKELMSEMGLDAAAAEDPRFVRFFSGDKAALPEFQVSWATPYALSIMGEQLYHNCPFGNGNGYGDGRAVSVGEILNGNKRFEMQLKGGGRTPFCRGADGRAVLRSSLREFLASEAMHFLGVPTTRALCLIKSNQDTVRRAWYSDSKEEAPTVTEDDPRLAHFPPQVRAQLVRQLSQRSSEPDVALQETAAITTRVAPSFTRIGHLDLFARRAMADSSRLPELKEILAHAIFREDNDLWKEDLSQDTEALKEASLIFGKRVAQRLAILAAHWLRVGFCQGNFNADNCLVGGRTMDYGPFGFMDKYDPDFAKWVGSGSHFAFSAQPNAALANFKTLATSLLPLFKDDPTPLKHLVEGDALTKIFQDAVDDTFRQKLGFLSVSESSKHAWQTLEPLLRKTFDYTIFFRELSENPTTVKAKDLIDKAAYDDNITVDQLDAWLSDWRSSFEDDSVQERMIAANPKYILREWMLVDAYQAAMKNDMSIAEELYDLIKRPYEDQGPALNAKYYKRAQKADLAKPGTAFMT